MTILAGPAARDLFPIFSEYEQHHAARLTYLDSAASSQKPKIVIDRINTFLTTEYANINRGAYTLSANATKNFQEARKKIAEFIGAKSSESIVFTKGTTESINLVSNAAECFFNKGDFVLLPLFEHHSNIVPWQLLSDRYGIKLKFVDIKPNGCFDKDLFITEIKNNKPRLIALNRSFKRIGRISTAS